MPSYETSAGVPTRGLTYAKMLDHLREAETCASLMAHLTKAEGTIADEALANGWLAIADRLRIMCHVVTTMAQSRMN
jgi:hypothetical protein